MVYPPQLTIQLRQRQLKDIYGNNIIFTGSTPLTLSQTIGTVGTTGAWRDYTNFVDGLPKISLTWSTTQTPTGQLGEGQLLPKKGVSGTLTFEKDAYEFLKSILVDDVAAPLNQVEVQITDLNCGAFEGYIIRSSSLSWCEFNSTCTYDLNLKQEDIFIQCIERTLIADNWQGWFQTEPMNANLATPTPKYHPRFSYCTEHRPNGMLVIQWYMFSTLGFISFIIYLLELAINGLISILNAIIGVINTVITALNAVTGGSIGTISTIAYLPVDSVFDSAAEMFVEAAGCGREHPSPLIRDYITNVCDKCGVQVNAATADIFFAPIINIQTSDGIAYDKPNPHYNACLFFPAVKRGVRRFESINLFGTSAMNTTTFYDTDNQPVWALSDMLDYLKLVYNAQWRVIMELGAPTLYFKRKDWYENEAALFDFSIGGADRHKLIQGICYEPTDYTVPASCSGLYKDDPGDKCGHEASMPMNGDPLSFNNTMINPLFHGILDKLSGFGATKFRLDGASTDYIYDAGQVVATYSLVNLLTIGSQMAAVFDRIRQFGDYAVLLQGETVSLPKILIWDGIDNNTGMPTSGNPYLNARAIRSTIIIAGVTYALGKTGWPGTVPGITEPNINTLYPSQIPAGMVVLSSLIAPSTVPTLLAWHDKYPPKTKVIGLTVTSVPPHIGEYSIREFGADVSRNAAILVNFPMYFEPYYLDTMWDWFHWIDDPYRHPRLHKNWNLKIPFCCEDANRLKMMGDASGIKLLGVVRLDTAFYNSGVITDIEVGYDTTNSQSNSGTGQYLLLKGIV